MKKTNVGVSMLSLVLGSAAFADAGDDCVAIGAITPPAWKLTVENDVLGLDNWLNKNDDRNYTMGVLLSTYGEGSRSGVTAKGLAVIDRLWSLDKRPGQVCSYAQTDYGVSAFTPNDLEDPNPIFGDRPYASLMMISSFKTRVFENRATRTKLAVGILGLDVAKAVQRFIHNDLRVSPQDPSGWGNQISDGGEPTALYVYETVRPLTRSENKLVPDGRPFEFSYKYGVNVGYYTNVYAGLAFRFGRFNTPYHAWEPNLTSTIDQVYLATDDGDGQRDFYGFVGYVARVVGYNVLLQGQFRDSNVTFRSSEIERLVHEASVGLTYTRKSGSVYTFAIQQRSAEFDGPFRREHWYGGITFAKAMK